ncbi:COPI alpha subunit C-terminus-domain-containing protein [Mortierella sp. GBAus27b]|nr:COPI alpha subunit C-terminus-domain-containing protein [Mortierella sp. GBAus27b]
MLKIAELRGDAMLRFHNSLLLGNVEERIRLLREVGQAPLAYLTARTHGMNDVAGEILQSSGLSPKDVSDLPTHGTLLVPPRPLLRVHDSNWPQLAVSKSYFEAVEHRGASLAPIESHGLDLEGDGRWDLDADLAAELHGETGAIVAEDCGLTILVAGQSEAEIWCRNSPLAADHVAAGAFESAIQAPQLVGVCREYILGLSIELVRRETQNDTSPAGIKRMLELAAYFTTVELQPKHMLVSLRTAMTASYKHKNL